jgi:hypothetical protein
MVSCARHWPYRIDTAASINQEGTLHLGALVLLRRHRSDLFCLGKDSFRDVISQGLRHCRSYVPEKSYGFIRQYLNSQVATPTAARFAGDRHTFPLQEVHRRFKPPINIRRKSHAPIYVRATV